MYRLLVTGIGSTATNDRQQIQLSHQAQNCLEVHAFSGLALDPAPNAANAIGLSTFFLTCWPLPSAAIPSGVGYIPPPASVPFDFDD